MRLLLDTHTFLWAVSGDPRLSQRAHEAFREAENELYLSAISYWEVIIKQQIGKLPLSTDWVQRFDEEMSINQIIWLDVRKSHCQRYGSLPMLHRDPFDRMLIAQALHERMTLLTRDENIQQYAITTIW